MEQYIQVNAEYDLVVCLSCQRALTPDNGAIRHVQNKHGVKGDALQEIKDFFDTGQANNPKTIQLPPNGRARQPVIPVEEGFKCRACPFITASEKRANIHWTSVPHTNDGPRYTKVDIQSWMSGGCARYWIVGSRGHDATIDGRGDAGNGGARSGLDLLLQDANKRVRENHEQWRRAGQSQQGADHDEGFVKDMRWVKFTEGKDRAVIAAATEWIKIKAIDSPTIQGQEEAADEKAQLVSLCEGVKRQIRRCLPRIYAVPSPILQRLHGIEDGKSHSIPFRMNEDTGTLQKYGVVCERYICFCWRAYRLGREEARNKLGMQFTDEQWGLLCDINQELQKLDGMDDDENDDSGIGSSSSSVDGCDSDLDEHTRSSQPTQGHTPNLGALDQALFTFMIASIKTKVGGAMYTNALLCFFAATAIRAGGDGFRPTGQFTGTLAAMLWILRLFFLEDSFHDMPLSEEDISVEKMEWFTEQHAQWLSVDRFTVVGTMIRWMALGRGHRNKSLAIPSVRWTEDYESLIHNGEQIRIHEFQRAAYRLTLSIDRIMNELFGGQWSTIAQTIDMDSIHDDTTFMGAGQSFATNEANAWLRPGSELAIKAAQSTLFDTAANRWKHKGVAKWLGLLRSLKELLMPGCYVKGGMPGRGPEVSTMRHCDGLQVMRNVFVYGGSVMIVTDRDKAKSIRDMGRKVARFMDDCMGRSLIAYIAWLLPAEEVLEQALGQQVTPQCNKEFMWRHGASARWNTDKLSALVAREIGTGIGVRIGVARYRIVVIEMGRIVNGLVMAEVAEMEKRIDDDKDEGIEIDELSGEVLHVGGSWNIVWDLQSTHSTRTARQCYAVHIGMPGHLTPTLLSNYQKISRLWHQFLDKGNPMKAWGKRTRAGDDEDGSRKRPGVEDLEAESLAALRELEGRDATWRSEKQEECMHAIMKLEGAHHLICVLPTGAGKSVLFMAPAVMRGRGTTVVIVPFSTLIDDLVERAQEKGVDVLHFQNNQVMQREALPHVPRLVIVSADMAVARDELFMAYMDKLDRGGHLQRIFIDEAHVAITDSTYREQLPKLKWLHRFSKPMIMLTATLMKTMERDFREMLLQGKTPIIRDRTTKTNARYEFVRVGRKDGAVEKAVVQVVRRALTSMKSGEKCIVYCKSIDDCRDMAETLGCLCHHSRMTDIQRRDAVARWLSAQGSPVMVATTGLGTGLDFRGIVLIIHSGIPYGLVDYIQQTGRGARREGQFVQCVAVHDGVKPAEAKGISIVSLKNQHAMWTVATAPGCMREQIAMIMDGVPGECCADLPDAVPCCRCEPSYAFPCHHTDAATVSGEEHASAEITAAELGTHALVRRIDAEDTQARGFPADANTFQEYTRQNATEELIVRRWLDEAETKCAACFAKRLLTDEAGSEGRADGHYGEDDGHETLGVACPAVVEGTEAYRTMRRRLKFATLSCCFTCKLPLDWCAQAKSSRGTPEGCVYLDKVLPVILITAGMTREAQWVRDNFEADPCDSAAFLQWLAGRREFMATRGTNMHMLWARIVCKMYGHRMGAVASMQEAV
jgi:superfamily II DNA or RNA helicase